MRKNTISLKLLFQLTCLIISAIRVHGTVPESESSKKKEPAPLFSQKKGYKRRGHHRSTVLAFNNSRVQQRLTTANLGIPEGAGLPDEREATSSVQDVQADSTEEVTTTGASSPEQEPQGSTPPAIKEGMMVILGVCLVIGMIGKRYGLVKKEAEKSS